MPMHCSECHNEIDIDEKKIQGYLWETEDLSMICICPKCVTRIIRDYFISKNRGIMLSMPPEEVKPAIRKLDIE